MIFHRNIIKRPPFASEVNICSFPHSVEEMDVSLVEDLELKPNFGHARRKFSAFLSPPSVKH